MGWTRTGRDAPKGCRRPARDQAGRVAPTKSRLPNDAPGTAGKASARTSAPVCGASIPDHPVILRIAHPLDLLVGHGRVDEPDSAVVSQPEVSRLDARAGDERAADGPDGSRLLREPIPEIEHHSEEDSTGCGQHQHVYGHRQLSDRWEFVEQDGDDDVEGGEEQDEACCASSCMSPP